MNEDNYYTGSDTFQEKEERKSVKPALILGVIWGAISIILFLITWYAVPNLMLNPAYGVLTTAISLGLAVYFTLDLRKKNGGYWNFSEALRQIFVMFLLNVVMSTSFIAVFSKFIDPSYADFMRDNMLNAMTTLFENLSQDQDAVDEMIAQFEEGLEKQVNPTFGEFLQGLMISVIIYFVGSLIFAAIFKRSRPFFGNLDTEESPSIEG